MASPSAKNSRSQPPQISRRMHHSSLYPLTATYRGLATCSQTDPTRGNRVPKKGICRPVRCNSDSSHMPNRAVNGCQRLDERIIRPIPFPERLRSRDPSTVPKPGQAQLLAVQGISQRTRLTAAAAAGPHLSLACRRQHHARHPKQRIRKVTSTPSPFPRPFRHYHRSTSRRLPHSPPLRRRRSTLRQDDQPTPQRLHERVGSSPPQRRT